MEVLITGAYGFLGRNTARKFKQNGHVVTGIGHGKWYEDEFSGWGIDNWLESTITFESLINMNKVFDIVVHCGGSGSVGYSTANPYEDFQKSVQSTLSVLEYIRLRCPKCKFIYPSSVAVQGSQPDVPIREDFTPLPISPYGFHKKIAEDLCRSYHSNFGITTGMIRFFSIYGEGLQKQLLYDACKKIVACKTGEIVFWGTGRETRDWVHVEDAVSLMYSFAMQISGIDIINCGGGERVQIKEVIELVKNKIGSSVAIKFNGKIREGDPQFFWSDISRARNYNWEPKVKLDDGIEAYVKYYKELKL